MANKTNIHLFYGADIFRAYSTLKQWKKVFGEKNPSGLISDLEKSHKPYHLSELMGGSSLFNPISLTIIRNPFGDSTDEPTLDVDDFLATMEKTYESSNHFILWQKASLDKRLTLTKKILDLGKVKKLNLYAFDPLEGEEALTFLASELKTHGLKIKRDAGQVLLDFTATKEGTLDAWYAMGAIKQLAAYLEGKESVEVEDVLQVVVPLNSEDVFFPLLETFAKRDSKGFLKNLETLTRNVESEQELLGLISALFDKVKNMIVVKNLEEQKLSANQIDEILEFKKGRARYLLAESRNFSREQLQELLDKIIQIEYNVKRGNTVLAPALSQLI